MDDEKITVPITSGIMKIHTNTQAIDMQKIQNRRFLFNPHTAVLVLGRQYNETSIVNASHAEELVNAGITNDYDKFVRGWIGTGGAYPHGVIHFAPCIDKQTPIEMFNRAFSTLEMFSKNGAHNQTVVRGFCQPWDQPLSAVLSAKQMVTQKPSVRAQIKVEQPKIQAARKRAASGQEL